MNGQTEDSDLRYQEFLRRMSDSVPFSQLPQMKMNLKGLSQYAEEKGVTVKDLTEEEKNQFGVFSPKAEARNR